MSEKKTLGQMLDSILPPETVNSCVDSVKSMLGYKKEAAKNEEVKAETNEAPEAKAEAPAAETSKNEAPAAEENKSEANKDQDSK